jgi:hypothetical protein
MADLRLEPDWHGFNGKPVTTCRGPKPAAGGSLAADLAANASMPSPHEHRDAKRGRSDTLTRAVRAADPRLERVELVVRVIAVAHRKTCLDTVARARPCRRQAGQVRAPRQHQRG